MPAPGLVTMRPGYVMTSTDPTLQAFFQFHQNRQTTAVSATAPVEIQQLAGALKNDPDLIYEYVHDNIVTLPQFGSLKGPLGTLLDGSGTVFDQAELTYALLQQAAASKAPIVSSPQMQFGTMTLTWDQLVNWLGTANNLNAVLDQLQSAGMFVIGGLPQSAGVSVTLPWVWVTATINSQSVAYDPAFKAYAITKGMTNTALGTALGYSRNQFLTDSGDFGEPAGIAQTPASSVHRTQLRNDLTTYAQNLANTIKGQWANGNLLQTIDIVGGKTIAPGPHVSTPSHPTSLPNHTAGLTIGSLSYGATTVIPSEFRSQLSLTLPGAATLLFNSSDIYGHKLSLFFTQSGTNYAPNLYLDGTIMATGSAVALTTQIPIGVAVSHPYPYVTPYSAAAYANNNVACTPQSQGGSVTFCTGFSSTWTTPANVSVTFTDTASSLFDQRYFLDLRPGLYNLVDGWGPTGRAMVEKFRTQLMQNIAQENLYQGSTDESVMGSSLAMMGATWLGQTAEASKLVDGITGTSVLRHHVIGVVGMVGWPNSGGLKGPYFDLPLAEQGIADRNRPDSTPLSVSTSTQYGAAASVALMNSAFEAGVIQQIQWDPHNLNNSGAISAVSMIDTIISTNSCPINDFNNQYNSAPGYTSATLSNYFTLGSNDNPDTSRAFISTDVNYLLPYTNNLSSRVIIPQCYYYNGIVGDTRWTGTGYITVDPTNLTFGMWLATQADGLPASMGGGYGNEDITPAKLNQNATLSFRPNGFSTSNTIAAGSRGNTSRALHAVADPVNLVTGDFLHSTTDLTVGSGDFPYSLSFQRSYDSGMDAQLGPLGLGWTHNFAVTAILNSDGYEALGVNSPINAAGAIASIYAIQDIVTNSGGITLGHMLQGALAANWVMDKIVGNVVMVTYPGNSEIFGALPDGSGFSPPPGSSSTLVSNINSCPIYTTKDQQVLSFDCGGNISTWQFPSGPLVTFKYDPTTLALASVDNGDLGRKLFFNYIQSAAVQGAYMMTSVSDGSLSDSSGAYGTGANARTVIYNYYTDSTHQTLGNNLMTVTGLAGAFTQYTYNVFPKTTVPSGQMAQIIYPQVDQTNPAVLGAPNTSIFYDPLNKVSVQWDGVCNQHYLFFAGTRTEMHDIVSNSKNAAPPCQLADTVAEYDSVSYFDKRGQTTLSIDPDNGQTVNTYDAWERPITSVSPVGVKVTNTYGVNSNLMNKVVTGTDGKTLTWAYTYETTFNKVLTAVDPNGNSTQYVYDNQSTKPTGNLMSVISPAVNGSRPTQRFSYDTHGRIVASIDPTGKKTTYTYGGTPSVLQSVAEDAGISPHLNLTTNFTAYTPYGDVTSVTDPNGHITTIAYDSARRKAGASVWVTATDSASTSPVVTGYAYDLNGNLMTTDRGDGTTVHFISSATHDNAFNILTSTDPGEPATQYKYDGLNRVSQVIDANGNSTQYTYNFHNQQMTIANPALLQPTLQTNSYNADGVLISVADGDGRTVSYVPDGFGRVQTVSYPDGSSEKYTLDNDGNTLSKVVTGKGTTSAGQQTASFSYTYDALNRVTSKSPQGQPTVNYTYDLTGRPASVYFANGSGALTYQYDTAGRLKTSTSQGVGNSQSKQLSYTWDNNGNRKQLTWPDGTSLVSYDYDELNRLLHIREGATALATFTYDSLSHRTKLALGDGSIVNYSYDPSKADLTQISHQFSGGGSFLFTYDSTATHQRKFSDVTDPSLVWAHPALGTTSYSYTQPNGATNYDQVMAVVAPGSASVSIAYDGRGNVTCTGTISVLQPCNGSGYTYDSENHLMTATKAGVTASYVYDPLGRRQSKNVSGTSGGITQFVDDGLKEIADYTGGGDGALSARTVFGPGSNEPLVIIDASGNHTYLHSDAQGSVVALSVGGARTNSIAYGPFGESAAVSGTSFGYTGHRYDLETGLYYARARTYSPTLGKFLQRDPVGLSGGINPYAYVGNDPINNSDPSGLAPFDLDPNDSRSPIAVTEQIITDKDGDGNVIDITRRNVVYYSDDTSSILSLNATSGGGSSGRFSSSDRMIGSFSAVTAKGVGLLLTGEAFVALGVEAVGVIRGLGAVEDGLEFGALLPDGTVAGANAAGAAPNLARLGAKFGINADSEVGANILQNLNTPVRDFISQYRLGSIKGVFPSEYLDGTVAQALKNGGSTVRKLLLDSRFAK